MSSDYPYGEGPTLKDFITNSEAKGIDLNAEVEKALAERFYKPKPFFRGDGPMSLYPPCLPKSKIRARKRKRKLQKASRRRNR